jgi:hypothetical protein
MSANPTRKVILDQVRRLTSIPAGEAPEGLIFYCARSLEGICQEIVARLGLKPSKVVFSNLATVDAHRLIDNVTREFAHTLRYMGNEVRHSLIDSTEEDTRLAMVLVRKLVLWFESLDPGEEYQDALGRLDARINPDWPVIAVVALLHRLEQGDASAADALAARFDDIMASRFLATLCAEALIANGRAAQAETILAGSATAFGRDKRHQELSALVLSRTGRLPEAEKAAKALLKTFRDDDETCGIAGGIFKRRWDKDATQTQALTTAHDLYKGQWEKGGKINAYLGVNAAATALYRGDLAGAQLIAAVVVAKMDQRDATLRKAGLKPQDGGSADYYDRVSRAEALLISGQIAEAKASYAASFAAYPWLASHIEGTRAQALRNAATLRLQDFVV